MESIGKQDTKPKDWGTIEAFLDDVDNKLKAFGEKLELAAGETQLQAHLGLLEAEDYWNKRKTELLAVAARLREAQLRPKAALDEGKIELYFGIEDAKEAAEQLRQRLEATERQIASLGTVVHADAKAAMQRLSDAYDAIKTKLLH